MRLPGLSRGKKSASTLPTVFSASLSLSHQSQGDELALPTKLDDVANSVHECTPQQLPGEHASQDDVRYFLYQVLTLKKSSLARKHPQWVLETCTLWKGDGKRLRYLPLDAFQQLCPLHPGNAIIDWTVKGSKFRRQEIPPCGVRDEIGHSVKSVVESLKRKEEGHRSPVWQNARCSRSLTATPATIGREQNPTFTGNHRFQTPLTGFAPPDIIQNHFYSLGNHSLPLLHQRSSIELNQVSPCLRRQTSLAASQCIPQAVRSMQEVASPAGNVQSVPESNPCDPDSLVACWGSPVSSCCQAGSVSSRLTDSTAQTSPSGSESESHFWLPKINQRLSIAHSIADTQCPSTELYQDSPQQNATAKPSRYKGNRPPLSKLLDDRYFQPAPHLAHLRSLSYGSSSTYAPSEASLTPSDSATNKYGCRHDSIVHLEMTQQTSTHQNFYSPSSSSNPSRCTALQTYATNLPYSQTLASSRPSTATPIMRDQSNLARPINNYKVDAHALDTAELIGCKSMSGPVRSLMANGERRRELARSHSDGGLNARMSFSCNVQKGHLPVGPFLRFQNPRTGQPRLTIYETIEQQEMLGKQHLESQRRIEMQQGRLRTVYETIEEQELLDGKPQRGADTCVAHNWSSYL